MSFCVDWADILQSIAQTETDGQRAFKHCKSYKLRE
jgi:hypothetical protein